jgi:hypothetical protein
MPTVAVMSDQCPVHEVGNDTAETHGLNIFAIHVIGNAAIGSSRPYRAPDCDVNMSLLESC